LSAGIFAYVRNAGSYTEVTMRRRIETDFAAPEIDRKMRTGKAIIRNFGDTAAFSSA
jgi:hypothetical protein